MKVVIVNLYNAKRRANHINSQLNRQSIQHTFFHGLDNNQFKLRTQHNWQSNGLIGCFISHIMAWQNNKNSAEKFIVFLEDDYVLPENFSAKVYDCVQQLPEDWDMSFLFWCKTGDCSSYQTKYINDTWQKTNGVWSTACIIVNPKKIDKITEVLNRVDEHIDILIAKKGWNEELNIYFLNEPIGSLANLRSQINTN